MSEERSVSVKAYLDLGGDKKEVRRFGLAEGVATSYTYLKERVRSVFGLGEQDITIYWQDDDGDSIVISSDEELMEAITSSLSVKEPHLLRIYITVGGQPHTETQGNQQGDLHEGVVCDGCDGEVRGFRYKCTVCDDFDLCGQCEIKGLHNHHRMARIPKPRKMGGPFGGQKHHKGPHMHFGAHASADGFGGPWHAGGGGGGGGGWFGGRGGWFGGRRRGRGFMRGGPWAWGWWGGPFSCPQGQQGADFQYQQQEQGCQKQKEGDAEQDCNGDFQWGSSDGPCPFAGCGGGPIPDPSQIHQEAQKAAQEMASQHVADIMKGIWTAWSGTQTASSGEATASEKNTEATATAASAPSGAGEGAEASAKSASSASSTAAGGPNQSSMNRDGFLKAVGNTVAHILDPLGIDVQVSVENNGIRQRCSISHQGKQGSQKPAEDKPQEETPQERIIPVQVEDSPVEMASDVPSAPSPGESVGATNVPDNNEIMEISLEEETDPPSSAQPAERMEAEHEAGDWTLLNREASPESQKGSETCQQKTDAASEEAGSVQQGSEGATFPPSQRNIYPSLDVEPIHSDPKIQRALDHMKAMGYTNEGGWLTNLLEMKNGDINGVLDLLQPANK